MFTSFFKESDAKFSVPKVRNGRRSMSVSTLLAKDRAGTLLNHKLGSTDLLPGGLGDDKDPESVNQRELKLGVPHEMEHTKDKRVATEIAVDHLTEDPKYYTNLAAMEKDGFALHVLSVLAPVSPSVLNKLAGAGSVVTDSVTSLEQNQPLINVHAGQLPNKAKVKDGDVPTAGQSTRFPGVKMEYGAPQTMIAPKLSHIGRLVTSPTDTVPSRNVAQPRSSQTHQDISVVLSSPDPQPITEVQTYGVGERA